MSYNTINHMNEYEHARQSLMTALQELMSSPFYYQKTLNNEHGVSDERYVKVLKAKVFNTLQDLLDDFS
jgi:hypothetical protein